MIHNNNNNKQITLYHGGAKVIDCPEIIIDKSRTLDFGIGFYTTTSIEQASKWLKIRANRDHNFGVGSISEYVFDTKLVSLFDLKWKVFSYDNIEEWFDFVILNRHDVGFNHNYDIVSGPVANDNVYRVLSLFEDGLIDKESAINDLKTYTLWDQYLFHTSSALNALKFCGEIK